MMTALYLEGSGSPIFPSIFWNRLCLTEIIVDWLDIL